MKQDKINLICGASSMKTRNFKLNVLLKFNLVLCLYLLLANIIKIPFKNVFNGIFIATAVILAGWLMIRVDRKA